MKKALIHCLVAALTSFSALAVPTAASAQSNASFVLSLLPVASVVSSAAAVGLTANAISAVPVALSTAGAQLVVKSAQASANGTVYVLERVGDGARVSVQVAQGAAGATAKAAGTMLSVTVVASGVLLLSAGEVLAFLPNEMGRALLHNEKLG